MKDDFAPFIIGSLTVSIISFFIGCSYADMKERQFQREAIKRNYGEYVLTSSNSTRVIFKWK